MPSKNRVIHEKHWKSADWLSIVSSKAVLKASFVGYLHWPYVPVIWLLLLVIAVLVCWWVNRSILGTNANKENAASFLSSRQQTASIFGVFMRCVKPRRYFAFLKFTLHHFARIGVSVWLLKVLGWCSTRIYGWRLIDYNPRVKMLTGIDTLELPRQLGLGLCFSSLKFFHRVSKNTSDQSLHSINHQNRLSAVQFPQHWILGILTKAIHWNVTKVLL